MIASTDSPRTDFSLGRKFLDIGIAVLAFVAVCAGLNALLPFPEVSGVTSKLRFFEEHRDDFSTVFIGSSCIRHQISPTIFDRIMREGGHPTRTFNFGVNGMFSPENGYLLEHLLRAKPRQLKWVFIELDEVQTRRFPAAERTRRSLYWHDWKRSSLVLRAILDAGRQESGIALLRKVGESLVPGEGQSEKRDLLFFHGKLLAENLTNLGRKSDLSRWASRLWEKESPAQGEGEHGDGYVPQVKEMTVAEAVVYEADLRRALDQAEPGPVSAPTELAYKQLANAVREAGAIPIFLVTPVMTQIKLEFGVQSGITEVVMSFNDARAYPQLYRKEMRVDADHLNLGGAEEFTRLVARNFSRLVQESRVEQ